MKVSIIVPVYNTEKYLRRCLDSLVNQTLKDIEIIIIDDKSPDNSILIIKEYENKYDNIKVIHNKTNKGIGYNRNLGIKKASGKYIMFIDSDDYVDITLCEKLYNKAINEKLDLVLCNYHKMLEKEDGMLGEIKADFVISDFKNTSFSKSPNLLLEVNLAPWNKLYKKELLNDNLFPIDLKYEDAIVVVKSLIKANKIGIVNEKLNYYLVRNKSETTVMDKRVFDILKITEMIVDEFKKTSYYEDIKIYVESWCTRNLFRYTIQQKKQKDKKLAYKFIDEVYSFLNLEFPNWKSNSIWKKRNLLKRIIESNKILTNIYISLF